MYLHPPSKFNIYNMTMLFSCPYRFMCVYPVQYVYSLKKRCATSFCPYRLYACVQTWCFPPHYWNSSIGCSGTGTDTRWFLAGPPLRSLRLRSAFSGKWIVVEELDRESCCRWSWLEGRLQMIMPCYGEEEISGIRLIYVNIENFLQ